MGKCLKYYHIVPNLLQARCPRVTCTTHIISKSFASVQTIIPASTEITAVWFTTSRLPSSVKPYPEPNTHGSAAVPLHQITTSRTPCYDLVMQDIFISGVVSHLHLHLHLPVPSLISSQHTRKISEAKALRILALSMSLSTLPNQR